LTIALFFLGHVTLTGAELYLSAASWTLEAELMDPRRRGEYQGAAELTGTLGRVWAPALYTFLVMSWGTTGWLIIAAIITIAAAALHPTTAMARRFLEQHVPADVLADASASDESHDAVLGAHDAVHDAAPVGPPTVEQPAEPGGVSPLSQSIGGNPD
jgi:MFS family permease